MAKQTQADQYELGGRTYTVDAHSKLGSGAEGVVILDPTDPYRCIKLFHPPEPGDRDARHISLLRGRKLQAILHSRVQLPDQFVLPQQAVYAPSYGLGRQTPIGYRMRRVPTGYHKLKELTASAFRTDQNMGLQAIMRLYADLFDDLALIHGQSLVVGDLNVGCIMFNPHGKRAWVDTDSWSYPGHPCLATTELFAHPDLYANLTDSGRSVAPKPAHDRFSLTVLLTMMAVPGAHPFRSGRHPTVRGLQKRTEMGLTIFDPSVKTTGITPEVLSDDLLNELIERLKRRTEAPLPSDLLRAFADQVTACSSCKTEYHASRRTCPKCRQTTTVALQAAASYLTKELWHASGTLLFAQMVGTDLYLVSRMGGRVHVIRITAGGDSELLTPGLPDTPGTRYRFFADCLAVCTEPTKATETAQIAVYRLASRSLQLIGTTTTGSLAGEGAVFDTSMRYLYRTAGNMLLRTEPFGVSGTLVDTPISPVYQQQSWFTADRSSGAAREVVFGYDRAFLAWEWFIIHAQDNGESSRTPIGNLGLRLGETIEDFAVYFSASSVLLAMQTAYRGHDYARYAVIGLDGSVHLNKLIATDDPTYPYWSNVRGKLHQGKSVLHATPDGLVKQSFSDDSCTTLDGTAGNVTQEDRLLRMPGQVAIVRRSGISTLRKK